MHKQIVINSTPNEVRVALLEDHEVVEFSMERADRRRVVGNVYKGKVSAVRPGLQAAFVEIGMDKAGFLHVSDLIHDNPDGDAGRGRGRRPRRESLRPIETMLKEGDEILVQVTKDVIGTKGPRLTADISLPGRFMVMMPKGDHVGVSRKIEERGERHRLRDLLASLKRPEEGGAFIIRTAAIGIEKKMLERDMDYLRELWNELQEKTHSLPAPALVHQDVGLIVGMVRDIFKDDVDSLIIDSRQDYQELMQYVKTFVPELRDRVRYYDGDIPIFDRFGIEAELKKSLDRKVWMKRGGFLVIDQTEALVAVDVNTGRFTGKKNQAETILKTNLLAAKEVARQVRLRDIGGIIVIDFIDMDSEEHKRRVLTELRSHLKRDRSRNKTFGISELGLVEMSRQRVQESLKDRLSDDCPYCHGSGQVLSSDTLANKVELLLAKLSATRHEKGVQVRANPTLALMLMTERANALQQLARESGMAIDVVDDPRLHREEFQILSVERHRDLVAEMEKSTGRSSDASPTHDRRDHRRRGERPRGRDPERETEREVAEAELRPREGSRRPAREDGPDSREGSRRSRRGGRRRGGSEGQERPERGAEARREEAAPSRPPAARSAESGGDSEESREGGSRRAGRRRRGRRGRGRGRGAEANAVSNQESTPRQESASRTENRPPAETRAEAAAPEVASAPAGDSEMREAAPSRTTSRRRGRRGRRNRGEEATAGSMPNETPPEAAEGRNSEAAPSRDPEPRSGRRSEGRGTAEERPRRERPTRRGREEGDRGSRRRGRRRDSFAEEQGPTTLNANPVAAPEDYVRPVPAGSRAASEEAASSSTSTMTSPHEPTETPPKEAPVTRAQSGGEETSAPVRRRRRRVRRSGIPTRVLGQDREDKENGS